MRFSFWLVLSACVCGITYLYVHEVLAPWASYMDAQKGVVTQMGDLYPRWVGTRELLLHRQNPYGQEVSHEIQTAFYGHAIEQKYGEPGTDVVDEQRFAYPIYVVFLLAPTVHASFSQLQVWVPIIFATLTAFSVFLWLGVLFWRPPKPLIATMILLILSSPQIVQGLRLQQLGLLVGFLLALSVWFIARNYLAAAGFVLALATVKPQMVILPLAWFLLWSVSALSRRWPLLVGFGATLLALVGLGELLLPGWPRYFLEGLRAYRKYAASPSLLSMALGQGVGKVLSVIVIVILLVLAWRNRHANAASPEFIRTLAAFLIGATLVLPSLLAPFNQILLLLPIVIVVRDWEVLPRLWRNFFSPIVAWPWFCSFVLLWVHPRVDSPNRIPLLPSATVLFIPFLLLLIFVTNGHRTDNLQSG